MEFLVFRLQAFKLATWLRIQGLKLEQYREKNYALRAENEHLQKRIKYLTEHPVLDSARQEIARLQLQNEQLRNQLAVVQRASFKSFVCSFGKNQ